MADDLSNMASQTLPQNALSRESSTLVNKINHHPKAPHLRPLWFSERHDSSIHLVEAEVDSGAGCNTFPLYLYMEIFGAAPLELPSVVIKAFGDQPRGSVVQVADTPKSYVVQDDSGARYQRNSKHVRSATVPTDSEDPSDATPQVEPDRSKDVPRMFTETGDVITRSGHVSRKTVKYTA
ncbi:hypothetical protein CAPTEDRAFT_205626 [Capitella teleta]|uniref:Uncharacterized protein n=1 Tax=Capitella teleta TaxID=283909 RepID=R7T4Q7_CAPTE|nr:hypothetical protein CAPTEDRAFT_205626 [Capitella teleta]|eukprot:ELT87846.1 hypothetical protein CAPTEDRAFT_205626 [Capitella teleta]